jgi:hypothetical protein
LALNLTNPHGFKLAGGGMYPKYAVNFLAFCPDKAGHILWRITPSDTRGRPSYPKNSWILETDAEGKGQNNHTDKSIQEVPPPMKTITGFINIFKTEDGTYFPGICIHSQKDKADSIAALGTVPSERAACIPVSFQVPA